MKFEFHPLRPYAHDVIVADPPWTFSTWSSVGLRKSAQAHYDTMDLRAIRSLPMSRLAKPDCVMLLWAIGPMLPEAIETLRGWGFTYKSNLVWRKTGANGRPKPGLGWWARSMHEQVLIGTIGEPFKLLDAAFPSVFDGEAREHSRKPESFYQMVEERMPGCERADLFGRATRRGWRSWGLEATKFDEAAE